MLLTSAVEAFQARLVVSLNESVCKTGPEHTIIEPVESRK